MARRRGHHHHQPERRRGRRGAAPARHKHVHRPLHIGDHGKDVVQLQKALNSIVDNHNFDWRHIRVDGDYGHATRNVARLAGFAIGLSDPQRHRIANRGMTQHAQVMFRNPKKRSRNLRRASNRREPVLKKLREEHHKAVEQAQHHDLIVTFDGKPVPAWIAEWLTKIRKAGWQGSVTSGVRTKAYSISLCHAICGRDSCPGTCAGASTNHACPFSYTCKPYEGAVDLSDYYTAGRLFAQMGAPLHNDLPSDRVHYSNSGH